MPIFISSVGEDTTEAAALSSALSSIGETSSPYEENTKLTRFQPLVLLWTHKSNAGDDRRALERLAFHAWSCGSLVLVRINNAHLPVGLNDLLRIDVTLNEPEPWLPVVQHFKEIQNYQASLGDIKFAMEHVSPYSDWRHIEEKRSLNTQREADGASEAQRENEPIAYARDRTSSGLSTLNTGTGPTTGGLWGLLIMLAGFFGAMIVLVVVSRQFEQIIPTWTWIFVAIAFYFAWVLTSQTKRHKTPKTAASISPPRWHRAAAKPNLSILFVSYSHADAPAVRPFVEMARDLGKSVWIDEKIRIGGRWAAEIVEAIKDAESVAVMCSSNAFASNHVVRELYLADKYRKPIIPVFLERVTPPADFEYFFSGLQHLELHSLTADDATTAIKSLLQPVAAP